MRLHLAIIITLYVIIMRFPVISQTDLFPEAESQRNLKSYYYSTNVKSYSVFSHWLASANASLTPPLWL